MITFFTLPKPFHGHSGIIQRNAIRSWTRLRPACQVLLLGNEPGTDEAASELGVEVYAEIELNELGTPLLHSAFEAARAHAQHALLCYVNADIILLSDFVEAVRTVSSARRRFLMVGRRCNLDVRDGLPMAGATWEAELRERARREGTLYGPDGIDYFVFPKETLVALPPFAVGRPAWDNWMIYDARRRRIAVVDATRSVLAVHQNHGYGHVKHAVGPAWEGLEADRNRALLGGAEFLFTLRDATHELRQGRLVGAWSAGDVKRRAEARIILAPPIVLRTLRAARSLIGRVLSLRPGGGTTDGPPV